MICLYGMRILKGYRMCDMVSEMPICTVYSLCRHRTCDFVCFSSCSRSVGRFVEETLPFSCRHTFLSDKLPVATRLTVHLTKPRSPPTTDNSIFLRTALTWTVRLLDQNVTPEFKQFTRSLLLMHVRVREKHRACNSCWNLVQYYKFEDNCLFI